MFREFILCGLNNEFIKDEMDKVSENLVFDSFNFKDKIFNEGFDFVIDDEKELNNEVDEVNDLLNICILVIDDFDFDSSEEEIVIEIFELEILSLLIYSRLRVKRNIFVIKCLGKVVFFIFVGMLVILRVRCI